MRKYKLKEVCEIIPGFAFKSGDFGEGENIVVKIKDITPPIIDIEQSDKVSVSPDDKFRIIEGDFVMAMTGATIGKVGRLGATSQCNIFINQRTCKFIPNEKCTKDYLYYLLNTKSFQNFIINNVDSKLAQPNIGHPTIYKYEHTFPTLLEQQHITSILTAIDRKINLNKAINHNLAAMAKQLYDYWFVQFDFPDKNGKPYKSSGGKMVWNDKLKRKIPEGWEVKKIKDIALVYNGATPSTTENDNYGGDIVWITPKDIASQQQIFIYQGERNITQKGYNSCSTKLLPINSILMSSRAPIGLLAINRVELCTNQGFKNLIPKEKSFSSYLYYYIFSNIKQIEQLGTGTTFKEVSREDILKFQILSPQKEVLKRWEKVISTLNDKLFFLQKEIETLTKQRDELLPLLMNGQVSVG